MVYLAISLLQIIVVVASHNGTPDTRPFTRTLAKGMSGSDVLIAQHLLQRSQFVKGGLNSSGIYDNQTVAAVAAFQHGHALHVTSVGSLDSGTALLLLKLHACDGYRDEGRPASSYGAHFLYKIVISVHANRSIETNATLFDKDNKVLHTYRVRTHGHNVDGSNSWPSYSHTPGLNSLSSNGNTPTGLGLLDLNTPQTGRDAAKYYGPYDINRLVKGLEGNMAMLLPHHIRFGILLHTGEWPGWSPSEDMPNSEGCVHGHPGDVKAVADILRSSAVGAVAHANTNGVMPYPYTPQGLLSIEQVDGCES